MVAGFVRGLCERWERDSILSNEEVGEKWRRQMLDFNSF